MWGTPYGNKGIVKHETLDAVSLNTPGCRPPGNGLVSMRNRDRASSAMEELVFRVKGSAREPYELIFIKDGDSLTAICSCPAGQHSNFCKHRLGILDGKTNGITSDNADKVPTVVGWLEGTDVESALLELREIEKDADAPKSKLAAAKKKLARAMNS